MSRASWCIIVILVVTGLGAIRQAERLERTLESGVTDRDRTEERWIRIGQGIVILGAAGWYWAGIGRQKKSPAGEAGD
jgi:hypothetical protein